MTYRVMRPEELQWITRPPEQGEPARHVAELIEHVGDLLVYVYGTPPETAHAELLDPAI
jgi:hypothetical protein